MKVAPQPCPHCGKIQTAHSDSEGGPATPTDGDIGMCIDCGGFLIFEFEPGDVANLLLRKLEPVDVLSLPFSVRLQLVQARSAWARVKAENRRNDTIEGSAT